MDTKDFITIALSALAFLLSAGATIISIVRSRHERQRAIKREITDTLGRIVSTALDSAKIYREARESDPAYFQMVSSILNQQNTFLLNQATFLAEQVPALMTAVEYNTIASAMANAGDLIAADRYYRLAIDASPNDYYRALALRSYAGFLFSQHRFENARELFKKSLGLMSGDGNFVHFTNGFTYQMWGWNEANQAKQGQFADLLFERAANEFNQLDNEMGKRDALLQLQAARQGGAMGQPQRPAFPARSAA